METPKLELKLEPKIVESTPIKVEPKHEQKIEDEADIKSSQLSSLATKQHIHSNKSSLWDDDIFRLQTIHECEHIFHDYCEDRLDQLRLSADKLSVLRSCCELLTRLDGTVHNEFAGRVLIFLAKFLPYFDRSGLNLKSEFAPLELPQTVKEYFKSVHEKNQAKLKSISLATGQDIEEGETISDDDEPNEDGLPSTPSNQQSNSEKLYEQFWSLQGLMNKPDQLFELSAWRTFRAMTDSFLEYFETHPAQYQIWKLDGHYMTEPKTLNLQINDVNMRRCVMVQILIILDHLDTRSESRPETLRLDNEQFKWIRSAATRIMDLLEVLPSRREGNTFKGFVSSILKDEANWSRWKNEKCFEAKPVAKDDDEFITMAGTYQKRRRISDELKSAKPYNIHVIGSPDVCRLWNRKAHQIVDSPDVTKYFNHPPEKQMELFKDPQASFRILRLLRKSPHFFVPAASVIQSLDGYLKALADKYYNSTTNNTTNSTTNNNSNNNVQQ